MSATPAGAASLKQRKDDGLPPAPPAVRRYVWLTAVLALFVIVFPHLPFTSFSILGRANLAGQYALVAISLVVLTGWVGQISLAQGAFVGVGAYVTGLAQESWSIGFPLNLVAGAAFGALAAALLGMVALRVRGLYLAVATLIFSWTADAFLFQQEWLTKHSFISLDPIGDAGAVPHLDFTDRTTYYYAAWATVALAVFLMVNLRDRKVGRAFYAVRGSEMAAASLGIDVVRTKLMAFAVSGALAGVAGSLMMIGAQTVTVDQFTLSKSLFFLSIAVVGGLASIPGAIASGAVFAGLEEVFFRVPAIGNYLTLVSAVLLAVVLLAYPGGLAALGRAIARQGGKLWEAYRAQTARSVDDDGSVARADADADADQGPKVPRWAEPVYRVVKGPLERWAASRAAQRQVRQASTYLDFSALNAADPPSTNGHSNGNGHHVDDDTHDVDAPEAGALRWETVEIPPPDLPDREARTPLIEVDGVVVRFGGLTAVNGFTMKVRHGEIVGLIGPNGAGKTTSFNSIAGFNTPADGRVRIHGVDVTAFPVHLRSRLGVARTFQVIQLFPQLDVFDNLLVATYISDRSGFWGSALLTNKSLREEIAARHRVREVIELLGLEDVAHRQVNELPFGILRMVEIARALVTGAPVMMLDEPASGLDDLETERLAALIRFIRSLGVSILLIEHDVKMVTSISDYMYVIDQGTPIAEGTPDEIKRNPAVIAAYLGQEAEEESTEATVATG